jgi:hypothetical protein
MTLEIGSFIELDLRTTGEYFQGYDDIARLNSARAGIYHACRLLSCTSVWIPYYLCPSVKQFLQKYGIDIIPYYINDRFEPIDIAQSKSQAVLLVNYFGIIATGRIQIMAKLFENVIIDNSAAFFSDPIEGCYNIYSPRKFFGVPDGSYVIGKNAYSMTDEYEQDFSADTSAFLMKRIESGLIDTYKERMLNEERINKAGILKMSKLTIALLNNIDYVSIKAKRQRNFNIAHDLFKEINLIDPTRYTDDGCRPMVYPLVVDDIHLSEKLKKRQVYVGRLWNHVLEEVPVGSFEAMLSKFLLPLPIDQRYSLKDLSYIQNCILNHI